MSETAFSLAIHLQSVLNKHIIIVHNIFTLMAERKTTQQELELKDFRPLNMAIGVVIVVSVILLVLFLVNG